MRGVVRILIPIAVVAAILLVAAGAVQNFAGIHEITTLTGSTQHISPGAVASQEAIKNLGTNGGGYYNANSAHPFENPSGFSNLLTIFLLLVIPFSLPRTFGTMVGSVKQGYAIIAAMGIIWFTGVVAVTWLEYAHPGTASQLAGGAMEGKEQRFGEGSSSLFAVSTTMTSTGSVNSFHDSYSGLSGGVLLLGMMLGEIAPGGTGSGLYGMLIMAVIAVFIAGLMVGRTPVTGSASAIDPHISPAYALIQVKRVAQANGLTDQQVEKLVEDHTEGRTAGFLGESHVNVLKLNLALKALEEN